LKDEANPQTLGLSYSPFNGSYQVLENQSQIFFEVGFQRVGINPLTAIPKLYPKSFTEIYGVA